MDEKMQRAADDLGGRLRALRERYPTLAISTEIIHQTDRLITFRATIAIEALVRAQGHAAQRAEPTGAFVMAAETMAVEQALLLGGFAPPSEGGQAAAGPQEARPLPSQASRPAVRAAAEPAPLRSDPDPGPETTANEADEQAAPATAEVQALLPIARAGTADETDVATQEDSSAAITTPPVAPRPKRDRQAERARAKARAASATLSEVQEEPSVISSATPTPVNEAANTMPAEGTEGPAALAHESPDPMEEKAAVAVAEPTPAPEATLPAAPTTDTVVSIQPIPAAAPAPIPAPETDTVPVTPAPPATPRKSRARSATTTAPAAAPPAATAAADTPTTREALRERWQAGRPIPAWWPQNRPLVSQPIGKTRVGRLRTLALDEEISTSLLDTYSTLLFGVPVAGLDQTQSLILEERLNPAYPSPLEELRVRRILHPLAVSDEMTISEDQPFFIHWSAVPLVEEAPEPPTPPTITWRERGKKGGGRRR